GAGTGAGGAPFFRPRRLAAARWRPGSRGGTVVPVRAGGPRRRRAPSRGGLAGPAVPDGRPVRRPSGRSDAARPIAAAGSLRTSPPLLGIGQLRQPSTQHELQVPDFIAAPRQDFALFRIALACHPWG